MDTGKGEHGYYKINVEHTDQKPLKAKHHYVAIDAVTWFIQKESNWFSDTSILMKLK